MASSKDMTKGMVGERRRKCSIEEPFVLPQPVLEVTRPAGRALMRLLWRVESRGLENVPLTGGLIIAANHQTYFDPFWIGYQVKRPLRFLAWSEIFEWPVLGKLSGLLGAWSLEINGKDPTPIRRSIQYLRGGGAIVIFPEGGRGQPDGSMVRFKTGAARMALEAGVPILPVTIRGAHRVWPSDKRLPSFRKVELIFHAPRRIEPQPGEDARCCARRETDALAEIIRSAL